MRLFRKLLDVRLAHLLPPVLFLVSLFVLYRFFHEYSYSDISSEIAATSPRAIAYAIFFTGLNYIVLTFYDALAFRYLNRHLAYKKIGVVAFISYAFSQNIGFAVLSGGAIRFRFYSAWGLSTAEIANIIAFTGTHFWLGLLCVTGVTCSLAPTAFAGLFHLSPIASVGVGLLLLTPVLSYLCWCGLAERPLVIRDIEISPPRLLIAIQALAVASVDWMLAATVLYVLLASSAECSFFELLSAFSLAQIAGVVSHVPGGLGVFETVLMHLISDVTPARLLGTLLVYRAVYYLLPFFISLFFMMLLELRRGTLPIQAVVDGVEPIAAVARGVVPPLLSILSFIAGSILLFSGAVPPAESRSWWFSDLLPLSVIEMSHFLGSVVGVSLMMLAWGIRKRVNSAFTVALFFLVVGMIFSVAKGLDYEEATVLGLAFLAFLPCKQYFYRKAAILSGFNWLALVTVISVVLASTALGMFSFKHVEYSHQLWWEFEANGHAPRFMRATIGVLLALFCWAFATLFRPARNPAVTPDPCELQKAIALLQHTTVTSANLVLLGDKLLFFNADESAFIMYRTSGRCWVSMGDPVGERGEMKELVWDFREACDSYDAFPVFYQVSAEMLPYYIDLGLGLLKLGEEAIVSLSEFTLDGARGRNFRGTLNKLDRSGYTFSVRTCEEVPALLPQLRSISDEWLQSKNSREKGFSLGFFSEEYLCRTPIALVECGGRIVAFANVWTTAAREELSVDIMRHADDALNGVMDYLFVQLMLWGKAQDYRAFSFGMAPLSGLESRQRSPLWNRFGAYLFQHGENFYNFEGLRSYKDKFHPQWHPRYLASPGGLALAQVLTNVTTLISGGMRGVFKK